MDKEIEELAIWLYSLFTNEHYTNNFENLTIPDKDSYFRKANLLIKEGYRKQSPRSNQSLFDENIELKKDIRDLSSHLNITRMELEGLKGSSGLVPLDKSDSEKWLEERHPEYCKCGSKIEKRDCGINGIDVCQSCFHEATKHLKFGQPKENAILIDEEYIASQLASCLRLGAYLSHNSAIKKEDLELRYVNHAKQEAKGICSKLGTPKEKLVHLDIMAMRDATKQNVVTEQLDESILMKRINALDYRVDILTERSKK